MPENIDKTRILEMSFKGKIKDEEGMIIRYWPRKGKNKERV